MKTTDTRWGIWPFRIKQPAALVEAYRERDEALALVDKLDKVAARYKKHRDEANAALSEADKHIAGLEARLDALTPARGQGGRFVGKAVSNG